MVLKDDGNFMFDNYVGCNVYYGVCEFGVVIVINGINFYVGSCVYVSIFMVFSDYFKVVICLVVI